MDPLHRLIGHSQWANRRWIDFVFDAEPADAHLARLISHILLAERIWFQRVAGEPTDKDVFATQSKDQLLRMLELHDAIYGDLAKSDLSRVLHYRRLNGEPQQSLLSDIVLHLLVHGAHHRGQMAAYASQHKLAAPPTDFIAYARTE